jgi:hypothetical protein
VDHGLVGVSSTGNWYSWRLLSLAYKRESKKVKRDEESEDEQDDWPGEDAVGETPIDSPPETITISSMIEPEEIILGDGMDEDWDSLGKGPGHSRIVSSDHSE